MVGRRRTAHNNQSVLIGSSCCGGRREARTRPSLIGMTVAGVVLMMIGGLDDGSYNC